MMVCRLLILRWLVRAAAIMLSVTVLACAPTPSTPEPELVQEVETVAATSPSVAESSPTASPGLSPEPLETKSQPVTPPAATLTPSPTTEGPATATPAQPSPSPVLSTPTPSPAPTPTPEEPARQTAGLTLPDDYEASVIVRGLRGPTQMVMGPDQRLWVAQLAGEENASQGQVVAVSLTTGEQQILLEQLFKPTGIAILADALWIAAGRDLLRAPLGPTGDIGPLETILTDLPFNGRSEGTLTVSPAGGLIFETSGQRSGNQASAGSAQLWELDPADPTQPRPIASGLKNAYAHTFDTAGRLWMTDVHDDRVNNDEAPPDELNLWVEGADFGWPACFGQQQPALNYGGTAERCALTRSPVVLFPPHSTPTGVVASPWEENTLLVALWGPPGQAIVRIPVTLVDDNAVGQVEPFVSGMQNPQHLLPLPDGSLLASDFSAGVIYHLNRLSAN